MKSNYIIVKLGDYIDIINRKNVTSNQYEIYTVSDSFGLIKSSEYYNKSFVVKELSNYSVLNRGEVVFNPFRISNGAIDYLKNEDNVLVSQIYKIIKTKKELLPAYLYRYIKSDYGLEQIKAYSCGSIQEYLSTSNLKRLKIPLPSLGEQEKIVSLLYKIEDICKKRELSINLYDRLVMSIFYKMFGDSVRNPKRFEVINIDKIAKINTGIMNTSLLSDDIGEDKKIDFYKQNELNSVFLESATETIYESCLANNRSKIFKRGSILMGMYDTANFKLGILTKEATANHTCINIETDDNVNNIWLYYQLMLMHNYFLKIPKNTRGKLSLELIKDINIILPPRDLQDEFARVAIKIDTLKMKNKKNLFMLKQLYKSTEVNAFKGKLDLDKVDELYENNAYMIENNDLNKIKRIDKLTNEDIYIYNIIKSFGNEFIFDEVLSILGEDRYVQRVDYDKIKNKVFNMLNTDYLQQDFKFGSGRIVLKVK